MTISVRRYAGPDDYKRVDEFLRAHYQPHNQDGNWLEPIWEYMHGHPYLDAAALGRIGIWEAGGQMVAVANYESRLGEAFFQFHPDYRHLREELLDHAEQNLAGPPEADGRRVLRAFVNDGDEAFLSLVRARGYERQADHDRPLYGLAIPRPFPAICLPEGFRVQSLADECDWAKVHRVLWRGFNHPGEPPAGETELESRRAMFDTPTARRDLKIAAVAPNGDFVAFCGMFCVPALGYAYVEPVATDPAYRRLGLGRAAVLEGIRRCGVLGATVAYVGSDQAFYQALGFKPVYTSQCWVKAFPETP
jgi:predicted N-acetyltransferase YhbS